MFTDEQIIPKASTICKSYAQVYKGILDFMFELAIVFVISGDRVVCSLSSCGLSDMRPLIINTSDLRLLRSYVVGEID